MTGTPDLAPDPHRRLYDEATALLRALEAAADSADGMALAGKFVAVLTAHIEPLQRAVADVEFQDRAERMIEDLVLSRVKRRG